MALFKQTAWQRTKSQHHLVWLALALLSLGPVSHAQDQVACKHPKETILLVPALGYEVAGTGRLYFHTAPEDKCLARQTFVIPGDRLIANEENGRWTWVSYSTKGGDTVEGWVETNRLKFIGTMGYTDPRQQDFYRKAAEAAQAGKLGSPFGEAQ